ncbi:hypothetical protein [Blautia massiliensis (ex Liu et al. 2021)]|uniref:hypothetical protein n=1 Tax=Blautia massiliensis (ex Liu et al. 2021) TaxID=3062492 RepID=UPI003F8BC564
MFCAPFRDLFAFIVSDGRSDFPQHLLIDAAHRRSQRARRFRGVEIENAHKVFVFKVVFRLQTAAQHQGITDTDLGGIPEGHSDVEFIILFQKRILKDAENVPAVVLPVFPRQLRSHGLQLIGKVFACRNAVVFLQHRRHGWNMLLPQFPQVQASGIGPGAGIRNIEHIAQSLAVSAGIDERDTLGTAPHIPAHRIVPDVELRTGGGVRALGMDHDLFVIRVFVQPRRGGEEGLPALQASGQLPLRLFRHSSVLLQFTYHRSRLLSKEKSARITRTLSSSTYFDLELSCFRFLRFPAKI